MMLHTMYYKDEVRDLDNFGGPDVELKDAEVKVAHQLIEALVRRLRAGKISRHLRREPEDADQSAPGRRGSHAGREAEEDGASGGPDGRAQRESGADAEETTATRRGGSARVGDKGGGEGREVKAASRQPRGKIRRGRSSRVADAQPSRQDLIAGSPEFRNESQTSAGYKFAKWPAVNGRAGASNFRHSPS